MLRVALSLAITLGLFTFFSSKSSEAALVLGPISDFQDGTTQGWGVPVGTDNTANVGGGQLGPGDRFIRLQNEGPVGRFAMRNASLSGGISSDVTAIVLDMIRPSNGAGGESAEIRLVLYEETNGNGTRWSTTTAAIVPPDNTWNTYTFPIREADLTRQAGSTSTYADLLANFDRLVLRHDPGGVSIGGSALPGFLGVDNIVAVPEPSAVLLLGAIITLLASRKYLRLS